MEKYLIDQYEEFGGIHKIYKFPNGYGASVIKNKISYGHKYDLWELMEIEFYNETDYEIGDDPIGWLNDKELNKELEHIMKKNKK